MSSFMQFWGSNPGLCACQISTTNQTTFLAPRVLFKRCFRFTGKSSKGHIEFVSAPCLCVHLPRVKIPHQSGTRVSAAKTACTYHCQHCTAHSRGWDSPLLCILSYGFGPVCNMQSGLHDGIIQSSLLALKILCAGWRNGLVV